MCSVKTSQRRVGRQVLIALFCVYRCGRRTVVCQRYASWIEFGRTIYSQLSLFDIGIRVRIFRFVKIDRLFRSWRGSGI